VACFLEPYLNFNLHLLKPYLFFLCVENCGLLHRKFRKNGSKNRRKEKKEKIGFALRFQDIGNQTRRNRVILDGIVPKLADSNGTLSDSDEKDDTGVENHPPKFLSSPENTRKLL